MGKISEEMKELVINLLIKGSTAKVIRRKTGISESSIYRIRNENEIINESDNDTITVNEAENDNFAVKEQIKFNLNRIAEIGGRTYEELLEEVDFILSEYDKITNRPVELFKYTVYLADVLMKLKIDDENEILDFLLKAESENIELEELEQKLESIKVKGGEEIEYYKNQTIKMEQEIKDLLQTYMKFKTMNSIEVNRYMKGNKGFIDEVGKDYTLLMQQNQGLIKIIKNIDPQIIENIVEKYKIEIASEKMEVTDFGEESEEINNA